MWHAWQDVLNKWLSFFVIKFNIFFSFQCQIKISPDLDAETYELYNMERMFANEIVAYEFIIPKLKYLSNSPK